MAPPSILEPTPLEPLLEPTPAAPENDSLRIQSPSPPPHALLNPAPPHPTPSTPPHPPGAMPNRRRPMQSNSGQRSGGGQQQQQQQQKGSPAHLYRSPGLKQQIHVLSEEVSTLSLRVQQQAEALQLQEDGAGDAFAELERRFQAAMLRMHKRYEKRFKAQADEISKLKNELRRKQRKRDDVFKREDDARMDFLEARIDMLSAELNGDEMVETEMIEAEELAASRSQQHQQRKERELRFDDVDDVDDVIVDGGARGAVADRDRAATTVVLSEEVVVESHTESRMQSPGTGQMKREELDMSISVGAVKMGRSSMDVDTNHSEADMKALQAAGPSPAGQLPPPPPPPPPAHLKGTSAIVPPPPPPAHPKPKPSGGSKVASARARFDRKR